MGKNRQLAINMIAQIVAFLVNFGISFFLTPFIIEHVGSEAYGFVGLANNFISYAQIVTIALNSMASRFITISIHQEDYHNANQYMVSVLAANVCMAVPLTVILSLLTLNLDKLLKISEVIVFDVTILWAFLFLNFILSLIGNVLSVATFSKNRLDLSSKRSIEANAIKVGVLLFLFVFFKPSVWYIGLATLLNGMYIVITNFYYTKTLLPYMKFEKKFINIGKIKELVASGIWNSISRISSILYTGLDLLLSNVFISPAAMGTLSVSKTLPTYVISVFGMLANVYMPQLTISYAKENKEDIRLQLYSSIKLLGFIACIPIAFLWVFGKEFFALWVPSQNATQLYFLSVLSTVELVMVLPLEPLWNIFTVTNKVKQSSLFLLINAVMSVGTTIVLLNCVSNEELQLYIIAGVSSLFGIIRGATFLPIYGATCLGYKWYTFFPMIGKNIVAIGFVACIALGIKWLNPVNGWGALIFNCILVAFSACLINFFIMLSKRERSELYRRGKVLLKFNFK